jgi:hypothetical protein
MLATLVLGLYVVLFMCDRSIVTPSPILLEPGIGVWPPDRTANWHGFNMVAVVRTFTAADTSSADVGCTMQLGANLLFPSKYEPRLASYAVCLGIVTRFDTELRVKTVH